MAKPKMNAEQRLWQAETDADTMARYEEIMGDASRRRAAISAAKTRAADLTKRANAMTRVAGTKAPAKKK